MKSPDLHPLHILLLVFIAGGPFVVGESHPISTRCTAPKIYKPEYYRGGDSYLMFANCTDDTGRTKRSVIDMNHCVGQKDGHVFPMREGNFSFRCYATHSFSFLFFGQCWLKMSKNSGKQMWTTIDMDTFMESEDGILTCFDIKGNLNDTVPKEAEQAPWLNNPGSEESLASQ